MKGAVGENLGCSKTGLHIGFGAGTGVLPLMDLVAHIFYTHAGINEMIGVNDHDCIQPGFKFKFYVSFRSAEEAIALEFLDAVAAYFKARENDAFELVVRLSSDKQRGGPQWNKAFLNQVLAEEQEKLAETDQEIKKIWICGTPVMTESFDHAFYDFKKENPKRFKPGVVHML